MEGLKAWQAKRRQASLKAANEAIATLQQRGEAINFRSVAAASGLTRKTLYQIPELKALVIQNRSGPQTHSDDRRHARIAQLESEVARLRAALHNIRQKLLDS